MTEKVMISESEMRGITERVYCLKDSPELHILERHTISPTLGDRYTRFETYNKNTENEYFIILNYEIDPKTENRVVYSTKIFSGNYTGIIDEWEDDTSSVDSDHDLFVSMDMNCRIPGTCFNACTVSYSRQIIETLPPLPSDDNL